MDLLDQVAIVSDDRGRQKHRGLEPYPGKEGGEKDKMIVLYPDSDYALKGEIKNSPQQKGLKQRPNES